MKIKLDYVTNSSSVCFYFLFKGKLAEDLFPVLRKYEEYFKLETEVNTCKCDVEDIIEDIKSLQVRTGYVGRYIMCPKIIMKGFKDSLERMNKSKIDKTNSFFASFNDDYKERIRLLKKALDQNMKRCIRAEWGDSSGDFNGDTGQCMDYTNGNLLIDEKDLIVFTVNEH